MRKDFLVFGSPDIGQEEVQEVVDSIQSGWIGTGPKVAAFEQAFASYKKTSSAVALNSCTAALHLAILAAGIGPGDEVITTPLTFCASVNAIIHSGATPVLADIDPDSMNIDPQKLEEQITGRTKAILPVHFAGRPCDMDALQAIAEKHSLQIIEDCAHAIETEYKGRKAGTFGQFGCFSFYVTKNVAAGEGGMVLAKDDDHLARIKILGLHGMSQDAWKRFSDEGYRHYLVTEAGFKYNMMDIQAAIGLHQLEKVEANWLKREAIWKTYMEILADQPLTLPAPVQKNTRHAYHLFTVLVDEKKTGICRDDFLQAMTRKKIGLGVHYLSIPEHPYYQQRFGWHPDQYPVSRDIGRTTVSLPLSPKLSSQDIVDVIVAARQVLEEKK